MLLFVYLGLWGISIIFPSSISVLDNTLYYSFFFLIGYLGIRYLDALRFTKYPLSILVTIIFIFLFNFDSFHSMMPVKLITAILGLLVCLGISWYFLQGTSNSKIVSYLKRNSYGIYLFHPMLIYILFYYTIELSIHPYLLSFAILLIAFALSIVLTEAMRLINAKIIIGEK